MDVTIPPSASLNVLGLYAVDETMSDEVSQFLEQVEQLRGKQIEDDQARAREREEFLAAKRERQARREGES